MYESQPWTAQDRFVAESLNFQKNGFFVDIGCHHYKDISNTYFLESQLGWRGVGIDIDNKHKQGWQEYRQNSTFICTDATQANYQLILDQCNAPKIIEYLSVDIEPPHNTLLALQKILETDYIFKIITFETDSYQGDLTPRDVSRQLLPEKGYKFIKEASQDDFWYHTSFTPTNINTP
jgi:hypothetical protein